jgi:threonylcarbamoyladenosine tRNA methylthiotransferase MtaB
MPTSIAFYTFGCRLNQAETASIQNSFESDGYRIVGDNDPAADILVINTCTVTENGDTETRRLVHKAARRNPKVRIALVGCQAQVQKEKLADLPNVRWIVGNQRKMDLVEVFKDHTDPQSTQIITPTIDRKPFTLPVAAATTDHRANIKIQDGCDFFCSFCEIPYARGRARSRIFDDILLEARALAAAGHKEIVLTGINIGTYGHEGKTLLDVIEALEKIEELERIRMSSIEPTTIPAEIFDLMQPGRKLCRYLHIPLQSGSDEILTAMKRKYTAAEFSDFVNLAYSKVPEICIGTDVIVGFPGETDRHFQETETLLRELPIHYVHVFSYSNRMMAQSKALDQIPALTIQERSRQLRELSERKRVLFYRSLLGSRQRVIFEGIKNDFWVGLTDNYVKIKQKSHEYLDNESRVVTLLSVEGQSVVATAHEPQIANP